MNIKQALMKLSKGELVGKLLFAYGTLQRMEEKLTASNTGSPKLPTDIVEGEICDYCVRKGHPKCSPSLCISSGYCDFLGRQLRAGA